MKWDEKGDKLDKIIKKILSLQDKAMKSGRYICPECGGRMSFTDDYESSLECDECGYYMDVEEYGFKGREDYNDIMSRLYPRQEDVDPDYDPDDDF